MNLTGVVAHGVELAETLAVLLQRHGYIRDVPADLDGLLSAAATAAAQPAPGVVVAEYESSNFIFQAAGTGRQQAEAALRAGLEKHAIQHLISPRWFLDKGESWAQFVENTCRVIEYQPGECLRDHERLLAAGEVVVKPKVQKTAPGM